MWPISHANGIAGLAGATLDENSALARQVAIARPGRKHDNCSLPPASQNLAGEPKFEKTGIPA
jgi:hypothetical protein